MGDTVANVVFILLDGFRHDYLSEDHTPSLHAITATDGAVVRRTREPFGFQSRPAFLAGLYPEESDVCMLFKYSPRTSPFRRIGPLARFGGFPKVGSRLRRRVERRTATLEGPVYRYLHTTAQVPLTLLPHFDYSEKELPWEAQCPTPTLFDLVRQRGGEFVYLGWPVYSSPHEDDRVVRDFSSSLKSTHDFIFVQLSRLDGVGHVYGPDSEELKQALRRTDADFAEILRVLKEVLTQFSLFVFGDHGMVKVKKHLPLFAQLKALKIKPGREYLAFLDSTTARFWFFDERARDEVLSLLRELEGGRVLKTEDLARHHIRFKGRSYGDTIFLASPGNLIHPSFFSLGAAPRGMHGYDPDVGGNQGVFIMTVSRDAGVSIPEVVDHVDLYATAVGLLGHELSPIAHGRDLLES